MPFSDLPKESHLQITWAMRRHRLPLKGSSRLLGEACVRLRDRVPEVFAQIPSAWQIVGFRNRLIHGYDHVDEAIVWDVINRKIPELLRYLP